MKIKLTQAIICEGKYDKIKLSNIFDATILTTEGFGIFKDDEKRDLVKRLSETVGIIIVTDSDSAGFVIRNHIKSFCDNEKITNVYIPELKGREKRKTEESKEGLLGVEGTSDDIIISAFERAGVLSERKESNKSITKTDLYNLSLVGSENSSFLRERLYESLNLPKKLSPNAFLEVANSLFSLEEIKTELEKLK